MDKPTFPKPRLIREDFLPEPMKNYRIKKVNHMDKPTFPKPRLIREDFLPNEPMKNYRIKKVNHNVLGSIYYVEKRTFLFFWENVYPKRSPFIGFYETYEAALQDIKDRVKKENTVEYIYDFE